MLVRKDGQEVPPTGDDILAFSMRDEGTAIVTADGRKFMLLKEGQFNEAQ